MADKKTVKLEIDIDTAFRLDEILRSSLVESGALAPADSVSIRPESTSVELDQKTAALFSQLLREGLIEAGAAHQSNNNLVARAVKKIEDTP
ncbi:MAG: hypothetical protein WCT03_20690 [Candidatus Obscuribacterales bacterium]|jgi:hypothetical protein